MYSQGKKNDTCYISQLIFNTVEEATWSPGWRGSALGHGLEDLLEGMLAQPGLERFQSV